MTDTLLPISATAYERALEGATARISDVPVLVRDAWDPDACPAALLPWLADAFSVDSWNPNWTDEQKRQVIKSSVFVHRRKGTAGAVRSALASLGVTAQLQEWFNQTPAGAPFTYRLLLEAGQVGIDQAMMLQISEVVDTTKNLRSHVSEIAAKTVTRTAHVAAAVAGTGHCITVKYALNEPGTEHGLLIEAAENGAVSLEEAVDQLHIMIHTTMPENIGDI